MKKLLFDSFKSKHKQAREQGLENSKSCSFVDSAQSNILNRQLETLKSCVAGRCKYGGGGNPTASIGNSEIKYPEGHPVRAAALYALAYDFLSDSIQTYGCDTQTYELADHLKFFSKFNLVFLKKTLTPTIVRVNVLEMQTKPATKPIPR